ncbi:MAG: hypothetical protein MJ072_07000, partial [Clostridia bacterium]|nr:hypothetical protein [Clostridia bacterium]
VSLNANAEINVLANGKTEGITAGEISVVIYGTKTALDGQFKFTLDPSNSSVSEEGQVTLSAFNKSFEYLDSKEYVWDKDQEKFLKVEVPD